MQSFPSYQGAVHIQERNLCRAGKHPWGFGECNSAPNPSAPMRETNNLIDNLLKQGKNADCFHHDKKVEYITLKMLNSCIPVCICMDAHPITSVQLHLR